MLTKGFWVFPQNIAASVWNIDNIPEGAIDPVITHIKTSTNHIVQPDNQIITEEGIQLLFGANEVEGVAYGEFKVESSHMVTNDGNNNVTITVHQHAADLTSQPSS